MDFRIHDLRHIYATYYCLFYSIPNVTNPLPVGIARCGKESDIGADTTVCQISAKITPKTNVKQVFTEL